MTRSRIDAWSAVSPGMSSSEVVLHPAMERTPTPAVVPSEGAGCEEDALQLHAWGDWDTASGPDSRPHPHRRPESRCFETQTEPVRIVDEAQLVATESGPSERESDRESESRDGDAHPDAPHASHVERELHVAEQQTQTESDLLGSELLVRARTHNVKFQVRPSQLLDLLSDAHTQTDTDETQPPASSPRRQLTSVR